MLNNVKIFKKILKIILIKFGNNIKCKTISIEFDFPEILIDLAAILKCKKESWLTQNNFRKILEKHLENLKIFIRKLRLQNNLHLLTYFHEWNKYKY